MKKSIRTALLATGLLMAGTSANAGLIQFSGSVTGVDDTGANGAPLSASGFSVGQLFSGTLDVVDAALSPGAIFGNSDIRAYRFSVGDTELGNDQSSIGGTVDADGTGLVDFLAFTGLGALSPDCTFCTSTIEADSFSIENFISGDRVFGDLTARIVQEVTEVPAPSGMALTGLALIGLMLLRRRFSV